MKPVPGIPISQLTMTTTIKADPDYYVLSLEELDNGQIVLSRHPVVAFRIFPSYGKGNYVTLPITLTNLPRVKKQTLCTPDDMIYEDQCTPCEMRTHVDCLKERYGDKLEFHVSIPRGYH